MRGELVAIDLETTGLDVSKDAVIEIGAVKMLDGKVIAEYSTMVDPQTDIPSNISAITGIRQEDVMGAPLIASVLPKIAEFVGDCPVIAHNISLDMGFLRDRHDILTHNQELDTYEIAGILLPDAVRYNLTSLTKQLGIQLEHAHRALDDARATALLYWQLWKNAKALPQPLLKEIIEYSPNINWNLRIFFKEAAQESQNTAAYSINLDFPISNTSTPTINSIEVDAIEFFGDGGILSKSANNFESRPQQIKMAEAIKDAFQNEAHLIIEAGTGTGKTLAYLLPALIEACTGNKPVVIATHTIQLQDQILDSDIPKMEQALGFKIAATVVKGRNNYLCPRKLEALRNRHPSNILELQVLSKLLIWLKEKTSGDLVDINFRGAQEYALWNRLSAAEDNCSTTLCENANQGQCPFSQAHKQAEAAHLVIINHALLISDALLENNVVPPFQTLVIDEAHRLEESITKSLTKKVNRSMIQYRIHDLGSPERGLLGDFLSFVRSNAVQQDIDKYADFVSDVYDVIRSMKIHIDSFFSSMEKIYNELTEYNHSSLHRIDSEIRQKPSFSYVQKNWNILNDFLTITVKALKRLSKFINRLNDGINGEAQQLKNTVSVLLSFFSEHQRSLEAFASNQDTNIIHWIESGILGEGISIDAAPLSIGYYMEQLIWNTKKSVILTGATLQSNQTFSHIKRRLYAEDAKTLTLESPFDYRKAAMIYIPNNIPEPTDPRGYQKTIERAVIDLATALNGRILVLFTSYNQLRETSQAITPRLALGNIEVFDQSDGTGRNMLLDAFKTTGKAVLMGTRSFWEGVDIPGDALTGLIITRLPFSVPSDPIFAARSETYDNAFNQYTLPNAIIRFRQGFGRLIRSQSDRGIAVILDSRVVNRRYGAEFLQALPDCTMRDGPLENLATVATSWIYPDI